MTDRIEFLAASIASSPIPMAVVDYAGRADADGRITERTDPRRRYGTRDLRHVAIYQLQAIRFNAAARDARLGASA